MSATPQSPKGVVALPFCNIVLHAQKPLHLGYPTEPKTIGDHIKKRRIALKLTQQQVADFFGVARNTISDWEWGTQFPSIILMPKVVDFLGYMPNNCVNLPSVIDGKKIRSARKILGLKVAEAAEQLGVIDDTISDWELGRTVPQKRYHDGLNRFIASASRVETIAE